MTPVLTSCVTMTPSSDSTATDGGHSPEQSSGWPGFWNVSKTVAQSFHPDFDPGQRPVQPDSPWIQLKIQPKELALRLVQKAIPANSYLNTINQVAMACLALASLPGCWGQTPQDRNPQTSKEPPGTAASTVPPGCRGEQIPVQSEADLAKIGREDHPCYPSNGQYVQTADIDAGNHSPILNFTGEYNGNGKSISNLNSCLFLQVDYGGIVRDLVVQKAHITINDGRFAGNKGVVACEASGHALLKNNTVEYSDVKLQQARGPVNLGMLAGEIRDNAKLEGNLVRYSNMNADIDGYRHAVLGILTGYALGAVSMDNNEIDNCRLTTGNTDSNSRFLTAGLMAGEMYSKVTVRNSSLTNNQLVANTRVVVAGGVAGHARETTIEGTRAINNTLQVQRNDISHPKIAVIVAGALGCSIRDTTAINNHLKSEGYQGRTMDPPRTGIVTATCESSTIKNTLAEHSELSSKGIVAVASAHADGCTIRNTVANNITITARQHSRNSRNITAAAIATAECYYWGDTTISQTTAIDCRISADESGGYAAVGVGLKNRGCSVINDTTACNSDIRGFRAGIAAGNTTDEFPRTFACNTNLTSSADGITRLENSGCAETNCLNDSPSAKTSLPTNLSSSPASSSVNATDNSNTGFPLNTDEVDAGIPLPALAGGVTAGILAGGILLYASYQWYQGYQQGLKGAALVLRPITRIKDAIGCHAPANTRDSLELLSV
ncbi:hypothetical protein J7438_17525 [Thalassotalea sp. G20_0]|uniref:hypothetical protein n=1 Tax=Thalassotalea sp. G20_0 TaxID=2821093 RepID=UPI001AD996B3|nr:hypothetical protein [Thalassotalea sp. G20_0]MBO9495867.1 hypothetical protein [Thalassotalea sp. G20_0]